jgi:hypothetical protein
MAERVLRGSRLGSVSYETEGTAEMAPRHDIAFACPAGHRFEIVLADEAELPPTWECKVCGKPAMRVDSGPYDPKPAKHVRTHWDMLMERRTTADLEEVLAERLALLRGESQEQALQQLRKAS